MISLRKEMRDSENADARARALAKAFLGVLSAVPKTALPANSNLAAESKETFDRVADTLKGEPLVPDIDAAGVAGVRQVEEICKSNKVAIDERDAALKETVETVAWAISSFRSHGERHKTNLTRLADGFETLTKVEEVGELRRRLRESVTSLRETVEQMRVESEESVRRLETQVSAFQERVEQARKETEVDRLTGLGSRREAEKHLQKAGKREGQICIVLFDIEGFKLINQAHGTMFGDKLLRAVTHALRERFPGDGSLFRWGADEFLALAEGSVKARLDQARGICESFAMSSYVTADGGTKQKVSANLACGVSQAIRGESTEEWYRRARENLELNRRSVRQ
ncbi:MAG: diguanylate cyclase [Ignavibacteriota bacterium]